MATEPTPSNIVAENIQAPSGGPLLGLSDADFRSGGGPLFALSDVDFRQLAYGVCISINYTSRATAVSIIISKQARATHVRQLAYRPKFWGHLVCSNCELPTILETASNCQKLLATASNFLQLPATTRNHWQPLANAQKGSRGKQETAIHRCI